MSDEPHGALHNPSRIAWKAIKIIFIYDCKKNDKPVDFYNFQLQVKLKTHMVTEEYRSELYNRKLEFLVIIVVSLVR